MKSEIAKKIQIKIESDSIIVRLKRWIILELALLKLLKIKYFIYGNFKRNRKTT